MDTPIKQVLCNVYRRRLELLNQLSGPSGLLQLADGIIRYKMR